MPVPPPAILLGGESIAVSAARSLSRAGAPVHALGASSDPVRASRHCREFADVGAGKGVVDRYLDWLEHRGPRRGAVIPCDDGGLELVANRRPSLIELGYYPVEADDDVLRSMLDKQRTYELSRQAGLPTPRTATVCTLADAERVAAQFEYPCALKPRTSHEFAAHYGVRKKVLLVNERTELEPALEATLALGVEMLATEIIPGGDDRYFSYYSYLDEHGQPLFHLCKHKLRQWPAHFGLATYHLTVWEPRVAELGSRFFQSIGLRGLGNVEFKLDPRDGEYKIIECNHRLTAATELVRRAGIDMALIAYRRAVGLPAQRLTGFRTGVRMWHPIEDLRALRDYRVEGELTLPGWILSLLHRQHFPLLSLEDPGPTLMSLGLKTRAVQRKVAARTGLAGASG